MTTLPVLITIPCLVIITFSPPSLSELCNPHDKEVLLQIKKDYNNPKIFSSWNPNTDCCLHWLYVNCDARTNRIIDFSIYATNDILSGPIQPQIGDLPYLNCIEIHAQPYLTGPIPRSITKLQRLELFSITKANISGSIPGFLGELTSLVDLSLDENNLTGPIPCSLSRLNLTILTLDRNKLSGKIPAWLGDKKFRVLDLSRNKLEGDASTLFRKSTKTALYVDLSRNSLVFNRSKVKYFPKGIFYLDLNGNNEVGQLPEGYAAIRPVNLRRPNGSYNRLFRKIPAGRGA